MSFYDKHWNLLPEVVISNDYKPIYSQRKPDCFGEMLYQASILGKAYERSGQQKPEIVPL